ncbi:Cytochrome c oxidase subunit 6B [Emydomyces testavorans]|uniref:Cytochrome c oxidase subunit 6B n=1 Tax=Emydomyces testavorans TaxID=2070801 RepID=A0AAF0DG95_9EURO|nr:Cytochrome c oxidase subunit 6B [Emydomyces testavorans]
MYEIPDADPDEPVETKPFKFVTGFDARFPNQNHSSLPTDLFALSPGPIDGMINARLAIFPLVLIDKRALACVEKTPERYLDTNKP